MNKIFIGLRASGDTKKQIIQSLQETIALLKNGNTVINTCYCGKFNLQFETSEEEPDVKFKRVKGRLESQF